jgi:hypothetical protein
LITVARFDIYSAWLKKIKIKRKKESDLNVLAHKIVKEATQNSQNKKLPKDTNKKD